MVSWELKTKTTFFFIGRTLTSRNSITTLHKSLTSRSVWSYVQGLSGKTLMYLCYCVKTRENPLPSNTILFFFSYVSWCAKLDFFWVQFFGNALPTPPLAACWGQCRWGTLKSNLESDQRRRNPTTPKGMWCVSYSFKKSLIFKLSKMKWPGLVAVFRCYQRFSFLSGTASLLKSVFSGFSASSPLASVTLVKTPM